jgi:hypothetical protein
MAAPPQHTGLGADERRALQALAPLRTALERLVEQRHRMLTPGGEPNRQLLEAEVELLWTLMLDAFRRGASLVHHGMRRAEGLDRRLADEALEYGLTAVLEDQRRRR